MTELLPDPDRYPIGKFKPATAYTSQEITDFISRIEALPGKLTDVVSGLNDDQLDTPYREGGWSIRQVIHHIADSHINAYIRIKWTLTEDGPVIKAYNEKSWAETPETKLPLAISINLLQALHIKFVALAKRIPHTHLSKYFIHPDTKKEISLGQLLGMYAWHGDHHLAHVTSLKVKRGW
ncbi:MAG: putative metal-dependent hydrolase [Cyclobacteriaceae bacterium]|nr:putative metal-dependent hydrolase [Cyclobacteriaceae bacterium]